MLLFTVQPKIDTKGHSYTLALQQILTGVYVAELCLIGLFSLRNAFGPLVMMVILLVATVIFNFTTNHYFAPLEQYLPADLAQEGDADEQAPLLSAMEDGRGNAANRIETGIQRFSDRTHVSPHLLSPLARFFAPHVYASQTAMKEWLRDGDFDEDDVPEYSEADIRKAYLNPAYTTKTPIVWLAGDVTGVSENEVKENVSAGIECSDQGAWIDENVKVKWSWNDFKDVIVYKKGNEW